MGGFGLFGVLKQVDSLCCVLQWVNLEPGVVLGRANLIDVRLAGLL